MVTVALVLVLAGCGGSSETDSPAETAARSAFVADLNKACAEWAHEVTKTSQHFEAVQVQASAAQRLDVTAQRYDQLADGLDRLAERAQGLTPPDADADTIDAWVASTQTAPTPSVTWPPPFERTRPTPRRSPPPRTPADGQRRRERGDRRLRRP